MVTFWSILGSFRESNVARMRDEIHFFPHGFLVDKKNVERSIVYEHSGALWQSQP
jgi:hypothetical protein